MMQIVQAYRSEDLSNIFRFCVVNAGCIELENQSILDDKT